MRIGIIADPHSNLAALQAVLKHMPRVDTVICAGDLVGYGGEPNEIIEMIRKRKISTILGDHDYAVLTRNTTGLDPLAARAALWSAEKLTGENMEYLRRLPRELRLSLSGINILVIHGSPKRPLRGYITPETPNRELLNLVQGIKADVIVLGHTHIPMKRVIQGKLLVNPGSVGQPRNRDPRASYALLTLGDELRVKFERVEYDVDRAAKKIEEAGLPAELATRLYFGW